MKITFLLLLLPALACAARFQSSNDGLPSRYFPLKAGLFWKYRYTGMPHEPQMIEIRITEEKRIAGKSYYYFSDWFSLTRNTGWQPNGIWVSWHDGSLYTWDGQTENQMAGPGLQSASLEKIKDVLTTQVGTFDNLYRFQDCAGCADAGTAYLFAENTGIVSVISTAIWGAAVYELIETNAYQIGAQ